MAVQIAGVTVPGPADVLSDVFSTARSVAGWSVRTVEVVAGLPERADSLLEQIERLLGRIDDLAARADSLVGRVDTVAAAAERTVLAASSVAGQAAEVVGRATLVTEGADLVVSGAVRITETASAVVGQAAEASEGATELLRVFQPLAARAAPLASTFVRELSEPEVAAAVRMVDQLPRLAEHLENDVMPILATLDRVGPDMHELLNVVKEVRRALDGIPGLGYFRRRGAPSGP
ncbi:MAG TPA: hypothetical protein VH008_13220 [Pseudonocardia sp.]|nr:hypothetical protein [Pseudonocardia sp.]